MSKALFVQTIGTTAIEFADRRVGPSAGRPFALLLYLASRGGQPSSRQVIQDLLFPFSIRERSHNLRQLLYRLRRLNFPIEADEDQITLAVDHVSVDWQDLVNAGTVSEIELEQLARGLFPGYSPTVSEAFQEWFDAERTEISLRLSGLLTAQLAQRRQVGRWDLVETTARALLALDPLSEEGTLAKAEALAISGSKSAALDLIDEYLQEIGEGQQLQLVPTALKRRISDRLPDEKRRSVDEHQFVGREEPMRALGTLGASTRAGRQHVQLLWGESGVGKTRLITEYRALATLQGSFTLLLSCQPHDVFRPLGILSDLVMQLLDAPGALGCDPGARVLLERLVKANTQLDDARESAVAQVSIGAVVRSLNDLLSAVAVEVPLLVFVDDAQWIDEASRTTIIGAFAIRVDRRSSLVLTSRERAIVADSESYADVVASARLNPLEQDAAFILAHGLLATSDVPSAAEIARQIIDQARGNPFVIRTLCAHYLATNDSESLKQTLTELLARRLNGLPPTARRTLETAVVLGKNCNFERLQNLLEMRRQRLIATIEELDYQGLIEVTEGDVVRSHALLADAVVARMAPSVLRLLHGAAARLLYKDVDGATSGAVLWDCAEHWRQAGSHERAIAVLLECTERAVAAGRTTDGVTTLCRALTLDMPDENRLRILEKALELTWHSNVFVEARYLLSEHSRVRRALGLPAHAHDSHELLELAAMEYAGPVAEVRRIDQRLRACIAAADASTEHRRSAAHLLLIRAESMLDPAAADLAYGQRQAYDALSNTEMTALRRAAFELVYQGTFGDPELARRSAREVVAAARRSPLGYSQLVNAAIGQYRIAPPSEAEETLRFTLDLARRYDFVFAEANLGLTLARLFWSTERFEECVGQHRLITDIVAQCGDAEVIVDYCILGARLATKQRRYGDAAAHIRRARDFPLAELALPDLLLHCCDLDIRLATGAEPVPDTELDELLSLHLRARGFGLHDEVMATVLNCLERNGRSLEGQRFLHDYLCDYRRDGFPVPSWLRVADRIALNGSVAIHENGLPVSAGHSANSNPRLAATSMPPRAAGFQTPSS